MLGGVFFRSQRTIVAGDEAGDGAVTALDDVTDLIAFGVDDVNAVAQVDAVVLDDGDLVFRCLDGPVARGLVKWTGLAYRLGGR